MKFVQFVIFICMLFKVNANYGGHDLFTSLAQLHSLWESEQQFVNKMEIALENMNVMAESMRRYIKSFKEATGGQNPNFDYLGHPLNGYFLVRHVALAYNHLASIIDRVGNNTVEFIENVSYRSQLEMLPSQDDIDGSLYGIARLHSLYGLDTDKFADDGIIKTVFNHKEITSLPSVMTLSSWDLAALGSVAGENQLFNTMIEMLRKAVHKFKVESETKRFVGDLFDAIRQNVTDVEKQLNQGIQIHDQTLEKRGSRPGFARLFDLPVDPKLRKKKKYKKRHEEKYVPITHLSGKADPDNELEQNFKASYQKEMLCKGKTFRTPGETKDLYCFYGHNGSPWLKLGPIKVDIQSFDPYIAVLRNLMFDHECDNITKFLTPGLDFPPGRMGLKVSKNDWTMKNVWPIEDDNEGLARMTRRVEHIMGLLAASNKDQSDRFMCGNYGIGGHYGTHPDYYDYDESAFYNPTSNINRISTVMTILEAPEAGGATVWPFVGVYVIPEKGSAVAWYNTRADAVPDKATQHSACPVLLGQKWIGNKWIAYKAQWETKKCTLNYGVKLKGPMILG